MVCARPTIQQVGQPRKAIMANGAANSVAGPATGTMAIEPMINPMPMAPRARWSGTDLLAKFISDGQARLL